jgi:signal peptidase I
VSKTKRSVKAFLLSILVPGLGQIYNGQPLAGILLAVFFVSFGYLSGLLGAFHKFSTAVGYVALSWIFQLAVAIHAAVVAARQVKNNSVPERIRRPYVIAALVLVVFAFVAAWFPGLSLGIRLYKVPAESMSPTLVAGDRFAVDVRYYKAHRISRGDVIVFRMPTDNAIVTKRVLAIEGDTIAGGAESTTVNGQLLSEPYLLHNDSQTLIDASPKFGPVHVQPNELFVVGDNREQSYDSRYFGPLDVNRVIGKALFIYYSSRDKGRIGRAIQ